MTKFHNLLLSQTTTPLPVLVASTLDMASHDFDFDVPLKQLVPRMRIPHCICSSHFLQHEDRFLSPNECKAATSSKVAPKTPKAVRATNHLSGDIRGFARSKHQDNLECSGNIRYKPIESIEYNERN